MTPNCDTVIDNPSFKIYSHAFPEIACEHGIDFHLSLLLIVEKMFFCWDFLIDTRISVQSPYSWFNCRC